MESTRETFRRFLTWLAIALFAISLFLPAAVPLLPFESAPTLLPGGVILIQIGLCFVLGMLEMADPSFLTPLFCLIQCW